LNFGVTFLEHSVYVLNNISGKESKKVIPYVEMWLT